MVQVSAVEVAGATLLALSGELDLGGVDKFESAIREATESDSALVVLDLRDLSFIDSTGLRLILAADRRLRKDGRLLALLPGPPKVHQVFCLTGLHTRLEFVDLCDLEPPSPQ